MDSNRTKTKKDLFEDLLYLALFLLFIVVSADQLMVMLQAKKAFGYEYGVNP